MSFATAVGPGACVKRDGDFAVACGHGQLLIQMNRAAEWPQGLSLEQAAEAASTTLVNVLWPSGATVPDEARAITLVRLYDRMGHEARTASLLGNDGAGKVLDQFKKRRFFGSEPKQRDITRAISLMVLLDSMSMDRRRSALKKLFVVGLGAKT